MCGIAGYLCLDGAPASAVILKRMAQAIAHRGPDGEGVYVDGTLGLAHRRLAIIDLSAAGHQPMASPDGRYVLSYNGEIYNFQELRIELEAHGCRFRSRTDTEVLLYALMTWGRAALTRLNGMFAFALWDKTERKLLLARDRYGIKPLYHAEFAGKLIFGSEVKALLAQGTLSARLDPAALVEYMTFQNFFTDRALYKDVRLLPAGTWLEIDAASGRRTTQRYWDFHFSEPAKPRAEKAYAEELDHLFRQAVTRQLVSDVDVGGYLSGGIDSGAIAAVASPQLESFKSFTVGFDLRSASGLEMGFDERGKAEYMSYLFKTEHYEMVLKSGDMERGMPLVVRHLEEPRVGQSYPNFFASKLASRFVKVVLAGSGGDEMFGGYPWRYYRAVVNDDFEHYIDKYYAFWQRLIPSGEIANVLAPVWGEARTVDTRQIFHDVFTRHDDSLARPEDYVNHSLYFEAKTFLHGLLVVEDKLAMAHGLETRVPFLDNDLVDFAMRLPVKYKLGNLGEVARLNENEPGPKTQRYFQDTRDGKLMLRQVLGRYVTADIADGAKQGFSAPDASWFRGDSIEYVRRTLHDPRALIWDFMDRKAVTAMVDDHLEGRQNRRLLIWSLLYLEQWLTGVGTSGHPSSAMPGLR